MQAVCIEHKSLPNQPDCMASSKTLFYLSNSTQRARIPRRGQGRKRFEGRARLAKLTPREFEVFRLVIAGLLNKEIGAELGVAVRTIKTHRAACCKRWAWSPWPS
jgi:FixJ family two-component response regulator